MLEFGGALFRNMFLPGEYPLPLWGIVSESLNVLKDTTEAKSGRAVARTRLPMWRRENTINKKNIATIFWQKNTGLVGPQK
jgi:hypothetical protein